MGLEITNYPEKIGDFFAGDFLGHFFKTWEREEFFSFSEMTFTHFWQGVGFFFLNWIKGAAIQRVFEAFYVKPGWWMINNHHISTGCLYICGIFTWNRVWTKNTLLIGKDMFWRFFKAVWRSDNLAEAEMFECSPAAGPNHHPNSGDGHPLGGTFKSSQGQWQGRHQKQGQFPWEDSESFPDDQCIVILRMLVAWKTIIASIVLYMA